jgi:hypothetical protein
MIPKKNLDIMEICIMSSSEDETKIRRTLAWAPTKRTGFLIGGKVLRFRTLLGFKISCLHVKQLLLQVLQAVCPERNSWSVTLGGGGGGGLHDERDPGADKEVVPCQLAPLQKLHQDAKLPEEWNRQTKQQRCQQNWNIHRSLLEILHQ